MNSNQWSYRRGERQTKMSRPTSSIPTTGKSGGNKITVQASINHTAPPNFSLHGKPPSGKTGKPSSPTGSEPRSPRSLAEKSRAGDQSMIPRVSNGRSSGDRPTSPKSPTTPTSPKFSVSPGNSRPSAVATSMPASRPSSSTSSTITISPSGERPGDLTHGSSLSSVMSMSTPVVQDYGASGDRPKVTLGEILSQIEERMRRMLRKDDFTQADVEADLEYIATQTRYSADQQIKRKIISKIVDMNAAYLFVKVFKSVHKVDYLTPLPLEDDGASPVTNGTNAGGTTTGSVISGKDHDDRSSIMRDDMSIASSSASKFAGKKRPKPCQSMANLKVATKIMWNTTDKSPGLCEECLRSNILQLLLTDLADERLSVSEMKDHHRLYLVRGYLGIIHNVNRYCSGEARELCRENGAVKILQQYLKSTWLTLKTTTIMVLSYIINESENDIINATDKHLVYIIKILEAAIQSENHFAKRYGFWAVEIAAGLNRLASNDANKSRIVEKGVLPLYTELLQRSCTEEEQLVAAQGIWIMAFNDISKRMIREQPGCMDALGVLERCSTREEIRKAAKGALWVLNDKATTARPHGIFASARDIRQSGHIMMSYQWGAKPLMLNIRDRLKSAGYRVWMDVDNMSGSTLEAMADAVEKAAVILICMSQKYKDSPSCRTEAEYTYQLKKDIVPIRVQHRYNPDGWLGIMIGTKLYFDFTRSDSFEMMMSNLIRELGTRGRSGSSEHRDAPHVVQPMQQNPVTAAVPASVAVKPGVARWKRDDVSKFLSDNGLSDVAYKLKDIDGELLMEIKKMFRTAPESFYSTMKQDLSLSFVTTLRLTKALDKLDG